ncbi:MAG TPA: hydrogenase maturation protease [Chromatiales bacterium]|nr:hydrogenase maturation protease [Chromatiales bacterium]
MTRLVVIGIGSPHGADRLGWQVIARLQDHPLIRGMDPDQVGLHCCDRPGLGLLEYLKGVGVAILVDAVAGGTAGRLVRLTREQLVVKPAGFSSHAAGVAEALALGETLQLLPAQLILYGMETGDEGEALVPADKSVEQLVADIVDEISQVRQATICQRGSGQVPA